MTETKGVLDFKVKDITGTEVSLTQFSGRVLLLVNVASKCGNTPQYKGLEELYERYKGRGLEILGFPANNFLHQEPGTDAEIREFCTLTYGVTFPMFSKISVKGKDIHPLFRFLTGKDTNPGFDGDIGWNFAKFLVGRDGKVIGRFDPKKQPLDPEVVGAIEKALGG
jgi:glutathione peroxidase